MGCRRRRSASSTRSRTRGRPSCSGARSATRIRPSAVAPLRSDVAIGGTSPQTPAGALTCSDLLALNEPDTATLSCFCTADKNPSFVATAKDIAKFQCETPGLTVTKTCVVQAADGTNQVDVKLMNTG